MSSFGLADSVKLPQSWRSVPDFTGLAPLRLIRSSSDDLGCGGDVVISDPCNLLMLQWVWFAGQEEKHFFLSPEQRWIWLCERDRRELRHFYGRDAGHPFFASSCERKGRVRISWPEFPVASIPRLNQQPLLVPMRPFNEYGTTHLGHFVVELLPLLLVAEMLSLPLLVSRPLPTWALELLEGVGLSQLSNFCWPVPSKTRASVHLGRAEIQLHSLQGRLLRVQPAFAAALLRSISMQVQPPPTLRREDPQQVAVLSRQRLARHHRWSNEGSLYAGALSHQYHQLFPEALGVQGVRQRLRDCNITVVVAAIGSAAYQLFLSRDVTCVVVLLCGGFDPTAPSKWFSTFAPFRHRFWLLYQDTPNSSDWNASFSHQPQHVDRAVSIAVGAQRQNCRTPMPLGDDTRLLPPEAPLGAMPSFGIDFS